MPVSVLCDSVSTAIRDSITNSSRNYSHLTLQRNTTVNDIENLHNRLVSSSRRVLLNKVNYEEVNNYGDSVLDTFKSKYVILNKGGGNSGKYQQTDDDKDPGQNISTMASTTSVHHHQNGQRSNNELPQPKRILFARENVQIGWRNSTRKWQVGAGMMNVGNTCYLNSTLQAVFHVPAMANWLVSDSAHRDKCEEENGSQGGCIICAMAKTLLASQSNQSSIRPYLVYTKLKLICKHLTMGRQEDAHEFLRYLVEAMEKSYLMRTRSYKELDQFSKETTPLNQILGGYLKSAVRCLTCGHVSTTFQHFQDILLDIRKANTVEEALDSYFARERLEDMGYKCEACKKKVSATKQFSLERAPISLCVQLKRFSVLGTKINKHITIRPRLDLTKYSSKKNGETLSYKLVAMVTHLGSSQHCGHYTAIGLTDSGCYYQFDDSCVRPIALQNVLSTNAYIMFYELDDNQSNSSRQTSTQVSGEHENNTKEIYNNKANGHGNGGNNHENGHANQQRPNSNGSSYNCPKPISKLELSSNATINNNNYSNTNGNRIIGPQLPEGFKLGSGTSNGSNNSKNHKTNGENSSSTNFKHNPSSANKLVIHFKNTNTNSLGSSLNGNTNRFQESNGSKLISKIKTNKNENIHDNNGNSDVDHNKSTDIKTYNKQTLPSMPKLLDDNTSELNGNCIPQAPCTKNSTTKSNNGHLQNGFLKSPIKSLVPYGSDDDEDDKDSLHGNQTKKHNSNKNGELHNGVHNNHTNNNGNSSNNCKRDSTSLDNSKTNTKSHKRKHTGHGNGSSFDDSSPDRKRSKASPSSPPIVKTKAGLWQVTSLNPVKSTASPASSSNSSTITTTGGISSPATAAQTITERKNPFAAATPSGAAAGSSLTLSSGGKATKDKKIDSNNKKVAEDRGPIVSELLKYSHRGYGGQHVLSWNGDKTDMEKQLSDDVRTERKREIENADENEMDRGKQKKVKSHVGYANRTDNPGFNPFQEHQHQQNVQNRRWNNNGFNGNANNNNNRFQAQNNNNSSGNGYNNNNNNRHNNSNNNSNHYNRNNNFRRNKYQQQRSHHHRNSGWR